MKTGIQEALPKTGLPRQGECGRYQRVIRYQPVIAAFAAIQRASIGDRLSLYAGCTLDRTLPADATGLDSRLRGNDIGSSGDDIAGGPPIKLVRQHNRCQAI